VLVPPLRALPVRVQARPARMLSAVRAAARGALRAVSHAALPMPPSHAAAAARALSTSRPALGVEEFLNQGLKHGEYPQAGATSRRALAASPASHAHAAAAQGARGGQKTCG
jgi:hypothetical protein